MRLLFKLLFTAIAVLAIAYILPGVEVENITVALIVAAVLAFLNAYLKPILILFTIPITLFTLGLFLLVINAAIILFTDYLIDGFEVRSFWWALGFSLLLSFATSLYDGMDKKDKGLRRRN
jgi:putative membrane protein